MSLSDAAQWSPKFIGSTLDATTLGNSCGIIFVLEYGITDHWMIDGRATVLDERGDGFHFDSSRLETRYRFFDEGTLPVDIAALGEINSNRDENGHQIVGGEPRLILWKRGLWQAQRNAKFRGGVSFYPPRSIHKRGGCEYDVTDFFHFGSEIRYDTQEHSVAVIPANLVHVSAQRHVESWLFLRFRCHALEEYFRAAVVLEF